jgi:uncharacterized protein (DUF1800 family)
VPDHADARTISHVLNRLGFGPRPGDVERVEKMGLAAYIDQQLTPDRIPDDVVEGRLAEFATLKMSAHDIATKFLVPAQQARQAAQVQAGKAAQQTGQTMATPDPNMASAPPPNAPPNMAANAPPYLRPNAQNIVATPEMRMLQQQEQNVVNELVEQKLLRETLSERQLNEVLVDFWFNHFNVFVNKGQEERAYLTEYERDVIRPHVLGNFRDLLGAVAHSPAMLYYLDNWESVDPNAQERTLAEQESRIKGMVNPMAQAVARQNIARQREQMQKQGARGLNENYGRELMELHTLGVDGGYTQKDVIEVARALTGWTINQPNQGGGFAFRAQVHDPGPKTILGVTFPAGGGEAEGNRVLDLLARHPSTAHHIAFQLAQRLVADEPPAALVDRAAKKFLDTDGDLREVVRTIVTSPEFFAADDYGAKVKTPLEFVVSAARATNASVDNVQPLIAALRNQLGMPPYGCVPPTGYSMTADAWVNTGALLSRMNFALQLVSNQMRGLRVDVASLAPTVDDDTRARVVQTLFAGQVSTSTTQTLAKAQNPQYLLALALGSPEFQKR